MGYLVHFVLNTRSRNNFSKVCISSIGTRSFDQILHYLLTSVKRSLRSFCVVNESRVFRECLLFFF